MLTPGELEPRKCLKFEMSKMPKVEECAFNAVNFRNGQQSVFIQYLPLLEKVCRIDRIH